MTKIILYTLLFVCYYTSLFIDWRGPAYSAGILAIISLIISFPKALKIYQVMAYLFLSAGLLLFFQQGKDLSELPLMMTSTVALLSLMFILPFINSVVVVGRYDKNVNKLLKMKVGHLGQFYNRTSLVSFILGSFLNIATLPLVKQVAAKNLKNQTKAIKDKFVAQALLRGYAVSLSYSPIEILIILTVDITGINYLTLLPLLLLFASLTLLTNMLFSRQYQQFSIEEQNSSRKQPAIDQRVFKKIVFLFLYLALFVTIIMLLNQHTNLEFLETVALVIFPYSVLWALSIKRFRSYLTYSIPIWKTSTKGLGNYMVLFLSAGFFITMLNGSFMLNYIQYPFAMLEQLPVLLFLFIQLLFLGLAMVGFHPLVTISIIGGVLTSFATEINPVSLSLVLITSALSTVMAGPFNISVSLVGGLLGRNPYQITWWNISFAFVFSSIGTILACILLLF